MIGLRLSALVLGAALLALLALSAASARTELGSKYGGTLVVAIGNLDTGPLDPTLGSGTFGNYVYRSICESLYEFDSKGQIVPELAVALPAISKDKLTYTIKLRKGVKFNDGTPFNAQAVVTSLQRMTTHPLLTRADDLSPVDTVRALGPDTVVIKLKTRFTPLASALATTPGIVMSPTQLAKLGDDFGRNPVCVGPFTFDDHVVNDHVTVIKSPHYYNQGAVYLDKIVYRPGTGGASGAAALKAGDIQVLVPISSTEVEAVRQTSSLRVVQRRSLGWNGIYINIGNKNGTGNLPYTTVGSPLASSPKLRQAFEEALDRKTIVEIVDGGAAVPGCTPISPASPAFDATVKCTPYDPEHARKLVAASGVRNPTVHLLSSGTGRTTRLVQVIQAMEAAVGINVVIDQTDDATYAEWRAQGRYDTAIGTWNGSSNTDANIYPFVATEGLSNASGYSNPRLDLILANSRKATSVPALKTLYHAAAQILVEDRPIIFLLHTIRYFGVNASVAGVQFDANGAPEVAFAQYR